MGNMGSMGSMSGARLGGMMASEGRWWEAFGTGGFEGEPSLMEGESLCMLKVKSHISHVSHASFMLMCACAELGINPGHILQKSLTVLNPLSKVNAHIMDDADLAGPFVFCFAFAFVLLLVSAKFQYQLRHGTRRFPKFSVKRFAHIACSPANRNSHTSTASASSVPRQSTSFSTSCPTRGSTRTAQPPSSATVSCPWSASAVSAWQWESITRSDTPSQPCRSCGAPTRPARSSSRVCGWIIRDCSWRIRSDCSTGVSRF
jgi:hypothetical protein